MRHFLIATHGKLAAGYENAIEMICGKKENVSYMNCYSDDLDYSEEIKKYMARIAPGDEAVILTDISVGSVNQLFVPWLKEKNIHLITGINLPLVLEMITFKGELNRKKIDFFVQGGLSELYYVDLEKIEEAGGDENFF